MKKLVLSALGLVLLLLAIAAVRTAVTPSLQTALEEPVRIDLDDEAAASRFARALTFPTVSNQDRTQVDSAAFRALHGYLAATYPRVHETLERETVGDLSLLYTWRGTDASLQPTVLMGHLDVVPVIPGTEDDWTHPPFDGVIADGYVWGRGAMDDKSSVLAVIEAVEHLIDSGFSPARTTLLAFGHDEEVGGPQGAKVIADLVAERYPEGFAFVLDEGGTVTRGLMPGIAGPVALVGVAEKGFLSLSLEVEAPGGHSSTPPPHTAVGILSEAITRLEAAPFPDRLDGAALEMLRFTAPEMSGISRLALTNLWLFGPLVRRRMRNSPETAAVVRTTTAATMFQAGVKDNVLPIEARAVVNFRILPGETVESVTARVVEIVDDPRVRVGRASGFAVDPSPVSSTDSEAFRALVRTIRQAVPEPDLVVAPYLLVGGTDARYYSGRSEHVYRFLPTSLGEGDFARVHGTDERLAVEDFGRSVRFMMQLLRNTDGAF